MVGELGVDAASTAALQQHANSSKKGGSTGMLKAKMPAQAPACYRPPERTPRWVSAGSGCWWTSSPCRRSGRPQLAQCLPGREGKGPQKASGSQLEGALVAGPLSAQACCAGVHAWAGLQLRRRRQRCCYSHSVLGLRLRKRTSGAGAMSTTGVPASGSAVNRHCSSAPGSRRSSANVSSVAPAGRQCC